jgi:WD40 repeat protein
VPLPSDVADQIRYDGWASNSAAHISPDGKYFAYETGRSEPPYDLQLRIIRLEDQEQVASIPLLRKDMNAATSELAAAAADALGDYLSDVPRELWEDELLFSIQAGIRTFQWSPIRPILAFVAQIDGPSTDLYVIDPSDPNPVRITAGLQNVQRLDWSPNGEWIAHGAAYIVGMGTPIDNYIVSRDGWTLLDLPDGGLQASGWVTSDYYLVNEAANGPGSFRLSAVRMPEPAFKVLWRGTFSSFALDLPNDTLIVSVDEPWDYGTAPGTYLVRMNTHSSSRIADSLGSITTWGRGADRFLGVADGVFSISLDGRLRQILDRPAAVSVSPDREMVALYPRSAESPTVLYDARLGRAREVFNGDVTCIEWAPDSLSFLVVSEQSLFSIDVSTTDVTQLADGLVTDGFTCPIVIVAK